MYIILFHTPDFMRTAFQCQPVFTLVLIFITLVLIFIVGKLDRF